VNGHEKRLPREIPSTRGDLGESCERGGPRVRGDGADTLDEYFLYILGPDLAGSVLEHLVVLALGSDSGLAGGLALCGVEGVGMVHGVRGEIGSGRGREGLLYGGGRA
jgi:hypothetical protein